MKSAGRIFSLTARMRTAEIRSICTGNSHHAFEIRVVIRQLCIISEKLLLLSPKRREEIVEDFRTPLEECNILLRDYLSDTPGQTTVDIHRIVDRAGALARDFQCRLESTAETTEAN